MVSIKMEVKGVNSLVHEPLVSTIELKTRDSVGIRLGQMLYTLERQGFFCNHK